MGTREGGSGDTRRSQRGRDALGGSARGGTAAVRDCSWARTRVGTGTRAGGSRQVSAVPMPTQLAGLGLPCRPRSGHGHRFSLYTSPNVELPLSARGRDRWERRCGAPRVPRVGLGHGSVRVTNPRPGAFRCNSHSLQVFEVCGLCSSQERSTDVSREERFAET